MIIFLKKKVRCIYIKMLKKKGAQNKNKMKRRKSQKENQKLMGTQKNDKERKHLVLGLDNKTDKCMANVIKTKNKIICFSTKEKNISTNTKK